MSLDSSQTAIFGSQENFFVNFKEAFFNRSRELFLILKDSLSKLIPYFLRLNTMLGIFTTYILDFVKNIFFSASETFGINVTNETDQIIVVTVTDSKGRPTRFHLDPNEYKHTKTYDASPVTISAYREQDGQPDEALVTIYEAKKKQKYARIIRKGKSIELVEEKEIKKDKEQDKEK